ncbi:alanine:cation symporter family protein [Bacteriovoracaceae bacterium]|nr:alanine:cation symporter family protein [Bacteriovoracaceae bacterium]
MQMIKASFVAFMSIVFSWTVQASESAAKTSGFEEFVNNFFNRLNGPFATVLFYEIPIIKLPLIVFVMVVGGIFFTFRFGFLNVKLFKHSFDVIRGKFDDPKHPGEISHFQALTSALSATVGLGNIAGVAVAIQLGGPGAVFWLWMSAFFGMSMKFSSCTLAQLYRDVSSNGSVLGGPMVYLRKGFAEVRNWPMAGKVLGTVYAVLTVGASFGGGNMFQGNQTFELLASEFPVLADYNWAVGVTLAFFAGIVLLGGISRIAAVTSKMVPLMCGFYVLSCLAIILGNLGEVPAMFGEIFRQAFNPDAMFAGGMIGVLVQGVRRASFSNEAGVGSAAIAHAAAKTDEPVREGVVAMIGPFIDTHIVCTMTSLAILITGAHLDPSVTGKGAQITALAFSSIHPIMPMLLTIASVIFAYSTVISWSYYGEKAWQTLFGEKSNKIYRIIYVFVIILGPILKLGAVIDFSDLMLLSMALPNVIGMIFLSRKLVPMVSEYLQRLKAGKMKVYK